MGEIMRITNLYVRGALSAVLNTGLFYLAFVIWKEVPFLSILCAVIGFLFCWLGHTLAELYDSAAQLLAAKDGKKNE